MSGLADSLRRIASDLDEANVAFALIGGLAVSVRTEPRFTRDADLAVSVTTDAEAEALVRHLLGRGYALESSVEQAQDVADLRALLRVASDSDVTQAQAALASIERRGYHRGRALVQAFLELGRP